MNNYMKLITIFATLMVTACSDDAEPQNTADAGDVGGATSTLAYSDFTLPNLGADFVYEGWLIVDDKPVSAGRFSVDDNGVATPASFELSSDDASAAPVFVLTIEPATGDAPEPADTHILAGALSQGAATLSTDHGAAINTDFSSAAGSYILATPTTGDNATLGEQGIWWLVPGKAPSAGLTLPDLPAGWVYEGWIVNAAGPVSTGRFSDPGAADADGAGATKGPMGDGPPFPGQDFINPATVLNDGATTAVISVEPDPDNSAMPFLIKPLVHMPIGTEIVPTSHSMTNNAANTLPAATITITAN